MSDVEFEYAVKQDVRNSPIVRELDRDRLRELWRWSAVVFGFVAVLIFSVWEHFELLRAGYRLEDMRKQQVAEEELFRQLQLERAALLAPQRIERLATRQLHLVVPDPASSVVIERVPGTSLPAKGVVASR
jgi:cell division protein FtsL